MWGGNRYRGAHRDDVEALLDVVHAECVRDLSRPKPITSGHAPLPLGPSAPRDTADKSEQIGGKLYPARKLNPYGAAQAALSICGELGILSATSTEAQTYLQPFLDCACLTLEDAKELHLPLKKETP